MSIVKVARSVISGRFISKRAARRRPRTSVVETYRVFWRRTSSRKRKRS